MWLGGLIAEAHLIGAKMGVRAVLICCNLSVQTTENTRANSSAIPCDQALSRTLDRGVSGPEIHRRALLQYSYPCVGLVAMH